MSKLEGIAAELAVRMDSKVGKLQGVATFHFAYEGYSTSGNIDNRAFTIELKYTGEMIIACNCDTSLHFDIFPNTISQRLEIFAEPKILTGNGEFDKTFLIRSAAKRDMISWISQVGIIESIRMLAPFEYLGFHGRVLEYKTSINIDTISASQIWDKTKIIHRIAVSLDTNFYKEDKA
jgi:hypothetical protein